MSGTAITCTNPSPVFGRFPTKNELKGIRYFLPADDENGNGGGGGAYTPPATQADLDRIIGERVARAEKPFEFLKGKDVEAVKTQLTSLEGVDIADLRAKAAQLATLQASQGADQNELTGRITTAETRATTAEGQVTELTRTNADLSLQLLRYQAAADAGIPLAHAPRLVGTTKEELAADATEYKKSLRTPGYDPGQGQQDGGAKAAGEAGASEAERRFGKPQQ